MQTSVTQAYLQVTKRVQPKLAKGNDCLSVSYTHKVRITERVPQHPKNWRKDSSDKARHRLKNVAAKATSEQRQSRLMRPVCWGFCFFCRQKKDTDSTAPNDCNQRLRVKQTFELLCLQKQVFWYTSQIRHSFGKGVSSNHCTQICINKGVGAYTSLNIEF